MNFAKLAVSTAAVFALSAHATPVTLNFGGYASGQAVASQDGVTFSLLGGPDAAGAPTINAYADGGLLTNSRYAGAYPTANILEFTFAQPVTDVSFTFENAGYNSNGAGHSYFQAFDASGLLLSTVYDTSASLATYSFGATTGIKAIEFNNGSNGKSNWWFGVHSLTATNTVPEPSVLMLALTGLGLVGASVRRKAKAA